MVWGSENIKSLPMAFCTKGQDRKVSAEFFKVCVRSTMMLRGQITSSVEKQKLIQLETTITINSYKSSHCGLKIEHLMVYLCLVVKRSGI